MKEWVAILISLSDKAYLAIPQLYSNHIRSNIPAQKAVVAPAATHGSVIKQTKGYVGVEHQVFGPGQDLSGQADGGGDEYQAGDDEGGLLDAETCS